MDGKDKNTRALLALSGVEEVSHRKKEMLLETVASPFELLSVSAKPLIKKLLGTINADVFQKKLDETDKIIDNMKAQGVHFVTYLDSEYPERLREINGYPHVLYLKGDAKLLQYDSIAVVGTRRPTRYGVRVTENFVRDFASEGYPIVSGLARGIDGTAHKTCVDAGAPTIAVFACGTDTVYPAENKGLCDAILRTGGLIISEYPLGVKPLQFRFPERNRIISGLSVGVFLPEAAKKSGSLITMNCAIEQGREIFVVPGGIYSEESEGCNALLREVPDALVLSPDDVYDKLGFRRKTADRPTAVQLSVSEAIITEALHDGELHFEELLAKTALPVAELSSLLTNLELYGIVSRGSGNYFSLY